MSNVKFRAAGGPHSRNVHHKNEATREKPGSKAIRPGAVSQIGEVVGQNAEHWDNGPTLNTGTKFGNQLAEETRCGPGGSRTVRHCGTQGMHGPANPGSHRHSNKGSEWPDIPPQPRLGERR